MGYKGQPETGFELLCRNRGPRPGALRDDADPPDLSQPKPGLCPPLSQCCAGLSSAPAASQRCMGTWLKAPRFCCFGKDPWCFPDLVQVINPSLFSGTMLTRKGTQFGGLNRGLVLLQTPPSRWGLLSRHQHPEEGRASCGGWDPLTPFSSVSVPPESTNSLRRTAAVPPGNLLWRDVAP